MVRRRSRARSYGKCPLRESRIAKIKKLYLTKKNKKILRICGSMGETGACPIRQAQGKL